MSRAAFSVWAALVVAACGLEPVDEAPMAAPDAGSMEDGGGAADAGDGADAGPDSGVPDSGGDADAGPDSGTQDSGPVDSGPLDSGPLDSGPTCPLGARCNPIPVTTPAFTDSRDTRGAPSDEANAYSCAPGTDESGGEFYYEVEILQPSLLTASLDDLASDATDVDLHLLLTPDLRDGGTELTCVARHNSSFARQLGPGTYLLVADTWVNNAGTEFPGMYTLTVTVEPIASAPCAMEPLDLRMYWTACAPGIDCFTSAGSYYLRTPATGPVVAEAHLVTVDDGFGGGWPQSATDGLLNHYQLSQAATGYVMTRKDVWAPSGEGGSQWGQAAYTARLPTVAESWYVNMYWRTRPAAGTRMIVLNPRDGRAVVAAGGYETGPGSNTAIGGVAEEIHHALGTSHRQALVVGFAADQTLPYGPVDCP